MKRNLGQLNQDRNALLIVKVTSYLSPGFNYFCIIISSVSNRIHFLATVAETQTKNNMHFCIIDIQQNLQMHKKEVAAENLPSHEAKLKFFCISYDNQTL